MSVRKRFLTALFSMSAIGGIVAQPAQAEPLTPLTPSEIQYLDSLRQVFAVHQDPQAFRSDGELLTLGEFVCRKRDAGQVGTDVTFQPAALTQLAFIYLCP